MLFSVLYTFTIAPSGGGEGSGFIDLVRIWFKIWARSKLVPQLDGSAWHKSNPVNCPPFPLCGFLSRSHPPRFPVDDPPSTPNGRHSFCPAVPGPPTGAIASAIVEITCFTPASNISWSRCVFCTCLRYRLITPRVSLLHRILLNQASCPTAVSNIA